MRSQRPRHQPVFDTVRTTRVPRRLVASRLALGAAAMAVTVAVTFAALVVLLIVGSRRGVAYYYG